MGTGQNSVVTIQHVCAISVTASGGATVTDSARNCTATRNAQGVCRIVVAQGQQAIESDKLVAFVVNKSAAVRSFQVVPVAGTGETSYDVTSIDAAGAAQDTDMSIVLGQWV
jgi:hypothetical protein